MPGQFVEGLTRMRWFGYGFAATYFGTLAMAAGALFLAIKGAKWPWFPSLLLYGFLIWLFPNVTGLFFTIGFMLISAVYVLSQGIQLIKSEKGLLLLFTMMAYAFGIWALHTMVEFPTMIATVFATLGLVTFLIIANDRLRPQPAH